MKHLPRKSILCRASLLALLFCTCSLHGQHNRWTFRHQAMGTAFRITVAGSDSTGLYRTIQHAFATIDTLEKSMSDYRADSELNQLSGTTEIQQVSEDLWKVLRFSRKLARRSKGVFDPTIGPLTKLWRRAFRQGAFPSQKRIEGARSQVQWKDLLIAGRERVQLRRTAMQLDLGGVAKGYALDVVAALLREAGFRAFLLDGGGDLLLGDAPPGEEGWAVRTAGGKDLGRRHNLAIATSGATYRFLEWEGVRYSHLIDPRTGWGITRPVLVTVIGAGGMQTDGLASALSIDRFRVWKGYEVIISPATWQKE